MKYIWLALIMLFMGCQSSAESSFQSLNQAFISWYYRFHPVEATRYGIGKEHERFRLIGTSEIEEYAADISRFIIELSQIDATKLSPEVRIDYHMLYFQLDKMGYIMNDIRPWEWNPLWILDEISEGLFLLIDRPEINMDDRVKSIQGRLNSVPDMLNHFKEMMISHSQLHIDHGIRRIDGILRLMDKLPLRLNSDNLTLDEIDESIVICKDALINFQQWLNQHAVYLPVIQFPLELKLLDQAFPYFMGERYMPEHVYKLADKKRIPAQNRIFSLALPIYLEDNDEPVWLDRDDTLEVIQWTIDHIRNNPENQVPASGILSHFYKSISSLEKFFKLKRYISKNLNKSIELSFAPDYIELESPVLLFNHHPKKINSEILYYIKVSEDIGTLFPLNSYEIDILNSRYIIPGQSIQIAHAQKFPSPIRYMFPDLINKAGWQIYALQMIVDKEFANWNNEYHILQLKEEVLVICQAIIEGNYYSGKISRKDAISYLRKQAFLNDREIAELMMESDLHYFSGTQTLIGMMEMNSLLTEYKKSQGSNFHISSFHNIILRDGIIPLYELKKQIFSH